MSEDELLSSSEAAALLGVSATSVKRWADDGLLACVRTAGKHRRFARSTVERFRVTLAGPAVQGARDARDPWVTALLAQADPRVLEALLLGGRAELGSWAAVSDRVGVALTGLGDEWARGHITVLEEHLASERLERALTRACEWQPSPKGASRALLTTAEGDEHTLGLMLVEVSLREMGWDVLFAGRATTSEMIIEGITKSDVEMVCLSASRTSKDRNRLTRQVEVVGRACDKRGVRLVLGGAGAWPEKPRFGTRLHRVADLRALLT